MSMFSNYLADKSNNSCWNRDIMWLNKLRIKRLFSIFKIRMECDSAKTN